MATSRVTGAKPTECPACGGLGYTRDTADRMETRHPTPEEVAEYGLHPKEWVECATLLKGSGCPRCKGTGQRLHA